MDLTAQVRKPDFKQFLVWWKIPSDVHNYVAMKIFVFFQSLIVQMMELAQIRELVMTQKENVYVMQDLQGFVAKV